MELLWTVLPAPGPIGVLTVGTTAAGLALVAFGDHPEAAAEAAQRLGLPAHGPRRRAAVPDGAAAHEPTRPRDDVECGAGEPAHAATRRPEDTLDGAAAGRPTRHSEAELDRASGGARPSGADHVRGAPELLERAAAQLREYFAGERRVFDLPLDWSLTRGSQRRVLETLFATVGYGETVTYGELAARSQLGSAYTAARGVGAIMGSNPLPVVVPCHRVMAADGLGGFGGGRATKEWLLAHEGVLTGALDFG